MRAVIQRVSEARVVVEEETVGEIGPGLLILLGIHENDNKDDVKYLVQKITSLRIFNDKEGKMNLSVLEIDGGILVISQFTLYAQTKKGNRPSYITAARPEQAIPLYDLFNQSLSDVMNKKVEKGIFGADMKVQLINDGPVTIILDSQNKDL